MKRALAAAALVLSAAGCGSSHGPPAGVTGNGRELWQFEALLHDTFGNQPVCSHGRPGYPIRFTAHVCTPLARYSPYWYVFAHAHTSAFHLSNRIARDFGNYPQPVLIAGRNVACDARESTWLIEYADAASFTLDCMRAGYVH